MWPKSLFTVVGQATQLVLLEMLGFLVVLRAHAAHGAVAENAYGFGVEMRLGWPGPAWFGPACGSADLCNHITMRNRMTKWLNPEYRPPDDVILKLMKCHWGVPIWGSPGAGATGILFFRNEDAGVFLSKDEARELPELKTVIFHPNASGRNKRDWLGRLGVAAVHEDCSRTRVGGTEHWVPLVREGRKPFGFTPRLVIEGKVDDFYVMGVTSAHVFGDNFTLAQRREYAKSLGADVGLVEPLKGKERK